MKKTIFAALAALTFLGSCNKDDIRIEMPVPEDRMHIQTLSDKVEVTIFDSDKEVLGFNWSSSGYETDGVPCRYFFKMDIADNNFETAIDKIDCTGKNSLSFTGKELLEYLRKWKISSGTKVRIEAEIIAQPVETESLETQKYKRPEVSKTTFELANSSEIYLTIGDSNYLLDENGLMLQVDKGRYLCTAGEQSNFEVDVPRNGVWEFKINYESSSVSVSRPGVWILGDACEAGWNVPYMPSFTADGDVMTWRGVLTPGEMKLALEINDSWNFNIPYLMPLNGDASPENGKVQFVNANSGIDLKWRLDRGGEYSITVNLETLDIVFEKHKDLKWDAVWMVGDATEGGWYSDPFRIRLSYDYKDRFKGHMGVFYFEGRLYKGQFKFPLESRTFEVPYLMPKTVNSEGLSPLPEDNGSCEIEYVGRDAVNYDHKWEVSAEQEGNYRLIIDTEEMTMTVQKTE